MDAKIEFTQNLVQVESALSVVGGAVGGDMLNFEVDGLFSIWHAEFAVQSRQLWDEKPGVRSHRLKRYYLLESAPFVKG